MSIGYMVMDTQRQARSHLVSASSILVVTGAGISASSGIPTYEEMERTHDPALRLMRSSITAFRADPCAIWHHLQHMRDQTNAMPLSPAHTALAQWMATHSNTWIVTQNADGLHERAAAMHGVAHRVIALHGSIHRARCLACAITGPLPDTIDHTARERLPTCLACGGMLRPDIVWFGEPVHHASLEHARELAGSADVCVVAGTRLEVRPARFLPYLTQARGGQVIVINPQPLDDLYTAIHLPYPTDTCMPHLFGPVTAYERVMRTWRSISTAVQTA